MRQIKIPSRRAALLTDAETTAGHRWVLEVQTRYDRVDMTFTNRKMAEDMFKQIKAQGTFGGQWLTQVDLKEIKDDSNK